MWVCHHLAQDLIELGEVEAVLLELILDLFSGLSAYTRWDGQLLVLELLVEVLLNERRLHSLTSITMFRFVMSRRRVIIRRQLALLGHRL